MAEVKVKNLTLRVLAPWSTASLYTFLFLVFVFVLAISGDEGAAGAFQWCSDASSALLTVLLTPWFLLLKVGILTSTWWTLFASLIFCSVLYGFIIARGIVAVQSLLNR